MPNHSTPNVTRDPRIDIVRGLGILCVVWGHTASPLFHYMIYMFHMPLFFVISGYLHSDRQGLWNYTKRKAQSLLLPYTLFMLAESLLASLFFPPEFLANSPWVPSGITGPLWFLLSLFTVCVVYRGLRLCRLPAWGELMVSLSVTLIGWLFSRYQVKLPLYLDSSLSLFGFYALGFHGRGVLKELSLWPQCVAVAASIVLYGLYKVRNQLIGHEVDINDLYSNTCMDNFFYFISAALVGTLMIWGWAFALAPFRFMCWLSLLGRKTLYIFGTHMVVIQCMELHCTGTNYGTFALQLALSVFIGILVSFVPAMVKSLFF